MKSTIVALVLCVVAASGTAQTVYRCGADGRTYSQLPCEHGRSVDVADPRSADQRDSALAVTDGLKAHGAALERERQKADQQRAPSVVAINARPKEHAVPPVARAKGGKKKRSKAANRDDREFTALVPTGKANR